MKKNYDFEMLNNEILERIDISDDMIVLYAIIRGLYYNKASGCSKVNLATIYDLLGIDTRQTTQTKTVKEALIQLKDLGVILYIKNSCGRDIDINKMKNSIIYHFVIIESNPDTSYTKIEPWAMLKALEYVKDSSLGNNYLIKVDKYKFLRFFLIILKYTNGCLYWQLSNSIINTCMSISADSILKYKDILEALELFYITRDYYRIEKDGKTFKTLPTFYGNRCTKDSYTNGYLLKEAFLIDVEAHLSRNRVKYIIRPDLKVDYKDESINVKKTDEHASVIEKSDPNTVTEAENPDSVDADY